MVRSYFHLIINLTLNSQRSWLLLNTHSFVFVHKDAVLGTATRTTCYRDITNRKRMQQLRTSIDVYVLWQLGIRKKVLWLISAIPASLNRMKFLFTRDYLPSSSAREKILQTPVKLFCLNHFSQLNRLLSPQKF